jgi:hypothetical protein
MTYPELATIITERLELEFANNPAFKNVKINNLYVEFDSTLTTLKCKTIKIYLSSTTKVKFWKSIPIIEQIIINVFDNNNLALNQLIIKNYAANRRNGNSEKTINYYKIGTINEWFYNMYKLGNISGGFLYPLRFIINFNELPTLLSHLVSIRYENDLIVTINMKNAIESYFHNHLKGSGKDFTVIKDKFEIRINKKFFTNRIRQEKLDELIASV